MVFLEFDPFGFLVKDLQTGINRMRCNSSGELYPVTQNSVVSTTPFALSALSSSTWHARVGHPGAPVFNLLKKSSLPNIIRDNVSSICQSCQLGKHDFS